MYLLPSKCSNYGHPDDPHSATVQPTHKAIRSHMRMEIIIIRLDNKSIDFDLYCGRCSVVAEQAAVAHEFS